MNKWLVIYFRNGEVHGPVWECESKRTPAGRASRELPEETCTYKIKHVKKFSEFGYLDSYIKGTQDDA